MEICNTRGDANTKTNTENFKNKGKGRKNFIVRIPPRGVEATLIFKPYHIAFSIAKLGVDIR